MAWLVFHPIVTKYKPEKQMLVKIGKGAEKYLHQGRKIKGASKSNPKKERK